MAGPLVFGLDGFQEGRQAGGRFTRREESES